MCTHCSREVNNPDDLCDACKQFWHAARSQAIIEYAAELIEAYRTEGILLIKDKLIGKLVKIAAAAGKLDEDLIEGLRECGVEIPQ